MLEYLLMYKGDIMSDEEFLSDYVEFVRSRLSPESIKDPLGTACYGLNGEAAEFSEHNKKVLYQGKKLDRQHLIKELGDVMFYVGTACIALDVSLTEVIETNKEKLTNRYPNGFTVENSEVRKPTDD